MLVELVKVSFSYGGFSVLKDVSFAVEEGKVYVIAGRSGSGKTTILDIIFGLLEPQEGERRVKGILSSKDLSGTASYVLSYPERYFFETTVIREAALALVENGLSREEAENKAEKALLSLGFSEKDFQKDPLSLSKGEKRKLAIASALAGEPDLLILDEPLSGLDYLSRKKVVESIGRLISQDKTVILTTHSLDALLELNPEIYLIQEQTLVYLNDKTAVEIDEIFKENGLLPPEKVALSALMARAGRSVSPFLSDDEFIEKFVEEISKN